MERGDGAGTVKQCRNGAALVPAYEGELQGGPDLGAVGFQE